MKKKIITFGEILLRLATFGHLRFSQCHAYTTTVSGGKANVAVSLANYSFSVGFFSWVTQSDLDRATMIDLPKYVEKH